VICGRSSPHPRAFFQGADVLDNLPELGQIGPSELFEFDDERWPGKDVLPPLVFVGLGVGDDPAYVYSDGDGSQFLVAPVFNSVSRSQQLYSTSGEPPALHRSS